MSDSRTADEFSALNQVVALRRDAGDYAIVKRGEQEEGRTYSWDQRHVRAWEAADSLEAAYRMADRLAGKLVDLEVARTPRAATVLIAHPLPDIITAFDSLCDLGIFTLADLEYTDYEVLHLASNVNFVPADEYVAEGMRAYPGDEL